jgi:hypothetical protein
MPTPPSASADDSRDLGFGEKPPESARSSMSSIFDFNDKEKIERQIRLQLRLQNAKDDDSLTSSIQSLFDHGVQRPSEYFGALSLEKLDENEMPNEKLTQLFAECFGKRFVRRRTSSLINYKN